MGFNNFPQDILGTGNIAPSSKFSDIGGDSFKTVQFIQQLEDCFKLETNSQTWDMITENTLQTILDYVCEAVTSNSNHLKRCDFEINEEDQNKSLYSSRKRLKWKDTDDVIPSRKAVNQVSNKSNNIIFSELDSVVSDYECMSASSISQRGTTERSKIKVQGDIDSMHGDVLLSEGGDTGMSTANDCSLTHENFHVSKLHCEVKNPDFKSNKLTEKSVDWLSIQRAGYVNASVNHCHENNKVWKYVHYNFSRETMQERLSTYGSKVPVKLSAEGDKVCKRNYKLQIEWQYDLGQCIDASPLAVINNRYSRTLVSQFSFILTYGLSQC